jgi:hypothetical protein
VQRMFLSRLAAEENRLKGLSSGNIREYVDGRKTVGIFQMVVVYGGAHWGGRSREVFKRSHGRHQNAAIRDTSPRFCQFQSILVKS